MGFREALTDGVRRSDALVAGGLLAAGLVQVLWIQPVRSLWSPGFLGFGLLLAVVSALPLAWRRVRPVTAAVVGIALWWVPSDAFLFVGYVCAVLLFFSLGRWSTGLRRTALACGWGIGSGTAGMLAIEHRESGLAALFWDADVRGQVAGLGAPGVDALLGILGFWLLLGSCAVGRLMASQERRAEQRLVAERDAARRSAVEEERARIVRELHDVVGHEVTLMSIQSEAASQALQRAPDRLDGPITALRETAHRAGRELRAILDLLGDGELAVAADGRGLEELATRAARLGIPNRLSTTGRPWVDAPRHWLAVNRIVQESLTNAGKHARGELVGVALDWSEAGVLVQVTNPARGAERTGTGHGIPSMVERARLIGGTLTAGHVGDRFEVTAWLPALEEDQR